MKRKQVYLFVVLVAIFIAGLAYRFFESKHEEELLRKTNTTTAILILIRDGKSVKDSATGKYRYSIHGTQYEYEENRNFNDLKVGDTILIKYSVEDPSVARVVDKYYMKKYHHLKNGD